MDVFKFRDGTVHFIKSGMKVKISVQVKQTVPRNKKYLSSYPSYVEHCHTLSSFDVAHCIKKKTTKKLKDLSVIKFIRYIPQTLCNTIARNQSKNKIS